MDLIVSFAEGFMNLFKVGADNFVNWVTGIVPTVLYIINSNEHINSINRSK